MCDFFCLPKFVKNRLYTKMSTTTQALELVKLLKPKIGEQAATKLVDYADKQGKDRTEITWLWRVIVGGFMIAFTLLGILYSEIKDTRSEIKDTRQELKAEMDKRFDKIENEQREQRKLLLQILQKK